MFQMNQYQSWSTFVVLALFVICILWLAYELTKRDDKPEKTVPEAEATQEPAPAAEPEPALEQSAVVAEAVADLRSELARLKPEEVAEILDGTTAPELFDWKKQGL